MPILTWLYCHGAPARSPTGQPSFGGTAVRAVPEAWYLWRELNPRNPKVTVLQTAAANRIRVTGMGWVTGVEPAFNWLTTNCLTVWLHPQ